MNIEIIDEHSTEDLLKRIREVPLLNNKEIKVYKSSRIEIKEFDITDLNPATFYLLEKNIETQRELRNTILDEYSIDTLNIEKYFILKIDKKENRSIIPPIVQRSFFEREGNIIEDGNHRAWLAKENGEKLKVVYITDVPEEFPYYALPNPNGWDDIKIFKDIQEVLLKKSYREKDFYRLYRCYDDIFPGLGKPR